MESTPRIVTIGVGSQSSLRQTNVKEVVQVVFPKSFAISTGLGTKEFSFFDRAGEPKPLIIRGQERFDLNDQTDSHNYKTAKIFCSAFSALLGKKITFHDPYEQAEKDAKRADQTLLILTKLQEKRSDTKFLTQIFRRVTGLATAGITPEMAFTRLFNLATSDPSLFFVKDVPVYEDQDWEMKALVDQALEKGKLIRDGKLIKQIDGKVLAADYDEAVFFIRQDPKLKEFLMRSLQEVEVLIPVPAMDKPTLSDELLQLADQVGVSLPAPKTSEDGSLVKDKEDEDADITNTIKKLAEQGIIIKNGVSGLGQKFRLQEMESDKWLSVKELIGYFKVNSREYQRYKALL